jgi:hypothetical protein
MNFDATESPRAGKLGNPSGTRHDAAPARATLKEETA